MCDKIQQASCYDSRGDQPGAESLRQIGEEYGQCTGGSVRANFLPRVLSRQRLVLLVRTCPGFGPMA